MGCDIHLFVEKYDGNKWVSMDNWKMEKECDFCDKDEIKDCQEYDCNGKIERFTYSRYEDLFYTGRNYSLFGILAGVRDSKMKMISDEKGFPDDASDEVSKYFESWGCDAHTPSYLSLKELVEYPWDEPLYTQNVTLELEDYIGWVIFEKDRDISPINRETWGHKHNIIESKYVDPYIQKIKSGELKMEEATNLIHSECKKYCFLRPNSPTPAETTSVVSLTYKCSGAELASGFMKTIEAMKKISDGPDSYEDVRIVFWFDN